ncbi:MAG: hypothetical protein ACOC40_03185 [Thermoplasmatota archaeon]
MQDIEIKYTNYVPDDVLDELDSKLERVLQYFPELWDNTIKVGYTSTDIGKYISSRKTEGISYVRLYKGVSLHTIAHELMHSVQYIKEEIPMGERPCELWTLAREPSILDKPPMSYLSTPPKIRNNWENWRYDVHKIADQAIQERKNGRRCYIKWFEDQLREL